MITKTTTVGMTEEQWHAERRKSIGGSDAGTILGLNKYSSPYALWAEKTGRVTPEDISDREAVRLGHDLEDYVAKRFAEATGKRVRRENHFLVNSDYPFAHALPDRMVIGENAGLECKTTSSFEIPKQCAEGEFPAVWYCQIMHYMMVTGAPVWYLAVLCFGRGFYWFRVERDEGEISALAAAEREFWQYVRSGTEPPVDGTDATAEALRTLYPDSRDGETCDLGAVQSAVRSYTALGEQIDELKRLQAEQAAAIGPVDAVLVPVGGVYTVDAAGAKAVCDALHPRCVVPMHYHHAPYGLTEVDSVEPFLELWPAEAVHHLQGAAFELTEQTAGVMVPSF